MAEIQHIDPPHEMPFSAEKPEAPAEVRGWRFRSTELAVLGIMLVVVVSIALPVIAAAREAARRIQCTNNLKQFGLGIQNFHDTYNGLAPLALGDGRASFFVYILPFHEGQNICNLVDGGNQNRNTAFSNQMDASSPTSNWTVLTPAERDVIASFKIAHCPSRRSGIQQTPMGGAADLYAGPLSDYAVVFLDQDFSVTGSTVSLPLPDVSPNFGWQRHQNPCDSNEVVRQRGAIRLAHLDCDEEDEVKRYSNWKPRDSFARTTDGTSNTFIVGEKHVRAKELGKYSASQDDQDGAYWFTSNTGGRSFNVARNIRFPLAKGKDDPLLVRGQSPARGPHKDFGFGSWHTGVVQFLRADGSVAPISVNTDVMILGRLGHAQDSNTCCEE